MTGLGDFGIRDSGFGVVGDCTRSPVSPRTANGERLSWCCASETTSCVTMAWAGRLLTPSRRLCPNPESRIPNPGPIVVKRSALSGFYLLDELTGWDRVLVVDAVRTGQHPPGTVLSFPFEALGTEDGPSPHAVGLPTVIRLGRQSGVPLPSWIHIVAIEADDMESFVEGLTPAVEAAVPEAVAVIRSVLAHAPAPASAPA